MSGAHDTLEKHVDLLGRSEEQQGPTARVMGLGPDSWALTLGLWVEDGC